MSEHQHMHKLLKGALTVVPIVVASLVVAYLVTHKPGPAKRQTAEAVQTLRVIAAPVVDLVPRAVGYGVAAPGTVWEAVAEVQGKIAAIHPLLKSGEVIAAQTVLVRIDPVEYELAVARLEAGVEETRANIRILDEEQANTRLLMAIEQRSLELARQSLARKRTALARKAISQDEVDREERNVLLQQQQLRQIENTLALMPSRRKALDAALVVQQSHLEQTRIDLTKTSIAAPFNCRLAEVRLEAGQYVRAGQTLFLAHGTHTTEIEARFSVEALRNLLGEDRRGQFQPGLGAGTVQDIFGDVRVMISLESGDWSAQWDGRIERLREAVDAETREMKVVAIVDRPYEKAQPGMRPPLTAGMFCRVELFAPVRPDSVVVPRASLKGDTLFVVDGQQRLQKVQVVVAFTQADVAVIRSGLSGGEQVVVSDASPAIMGMKVAPVADEALRQHLLAVSRGSDE